jgi:putative RecB family exonuclease
VVAIAQLSYSSIRAYEECPLRWRYLYVDHLPEAPKGYFSFGRTVHSVLEELLQPYVVPAGRRTPEGAHQRTLDEFPRRGETQRRTPWSIEELLAAYDRHWSNEGYTSPEEEERYRALGREILLGYRATLEQERPQPIAIEEHLTARWAGVAIHGFIDRIDRTESGGLLVMDYKTTRELSHRDASTSDQLTLYQVLVEKNFSDPVEALSLFHLRTLTSLTTPPRDRSALEDLSYRVGVVSDGIRSDAFEPTPGRQCSRCDFRNRCPEFRPVPPGERVRLQELVDRFEQLRAEEGRISQELSHTAQELHRAAENLGVHRVEGKSSAAVRKREESWIYPPEVVRPLLEAFNLTRRAPSGSSDEIRKLLRDPAVEPEVRRRIAETGSRRIHWYWELEPKER